MKPHGWWMLPVAVGLFTAGCSPEDEVVLWLRKSPRQFYGLAADVARHLTEEEHGWRPVERYESWERWEREGRRIRGCEEVLLGFLERKPEETGFSRWFIAQALGFVGTEKSVPVLIDIMGDANESEQARSAAVYALGEIATPGAVRALVELVKELEEWPDKAIDELSDEESGMYSLKVSALITLASLDDAEARRTVEAELRNPGMPERDRQYLKNHLTAPQGEVPPPPG